MKLKHAKVAPLAATLIAFGSLVGGASAAILFTSSGNDLVVDITSPIDLEVTTADSGDIRWGLRLENVFNSAQGTNIVTGNTNSTIDLFVTASSTALDTNGVFAFGSTTAQDLFIFWSTPSYAPVIGDLISISEGTFTLEGFLSSGISPDTTATSITASVIQGGNGNAIASTNVSLVPEPSSTLLIGVGLMGCIVRRKRLS